MNHEVRQVLSEKINDLVNEDMVSEAVELFNRLGGDKFDYSVVSSGETVRDLIETILDFDAYNLYDKYTPSARKWLSSVAVLAIALSYCCYHLDIAYDFYAGLGHFIVIKDARSFAHLDKYI